MSHEHCALHSGLTAILVWLALCLELHGGLLMSDASFHYMELFASQRVWSVIFLTAANLGIVGLVTQRPAFRLISVLVVATTHGIFAGCLILAGAGIWSGTYVIIAAMGYFLTFSHVRAAL